MPWRECKRMDERLRFVARLLDGEEMAALCREFGISRPTGYKIFKRYKNLGLEGLIDRSRRPYRQANRLPFQVERTIVALRQEHSTWGCARSGPFEVGSGGRIWIQFSGPQPHQALEARASVRCIVGISGLL